MKRKQNLKIFFRNWNSNVDDGTMIATTLKDLEGIIIPSCHKLMLRRNLPKGATAVKRIVVGIDGDMGWGHMAIMLLIKAQHH